MHKPSNFEELVAEVNALDLYTNLILQINKDLLLAGVDLEFSENTTPENLFIDLTQTVYLLLREKFMEYLNLLYIIDVPEYQIKQLDGSDIEILSKNVSFLILKREWQKVWYKKHY
jgi:hypothetical protein